MSFYNHYTIPYGQSDISVTLDYPLNGKSNFTSDNFMAIITRGTKKELTRPYAISCLHYGWHSEDCLHRHHGHHHDDGFVYIRFGDYDKCGCCDHEYKQLEVVSYEPFLSRLNLSLTNAIDGMRRGRYTLKILNNCEVIGTFYIDYLPQARSRVVNYDQLDYDELPEVPTKECKPCHHHHHHCDCEKEEVLGQEGCYVARTVLVWEREKRKRCVKLPPIITN